MIDMIEMVNGMTGSSLVMMKKNIKIQVYKCYKRTMGLNILMKSNH